MKNKSQNTSRIGFTLVELSIVLVIIGLLIGGILVGQSLISSAKITKQIRQIEQIQIAVSNFKNKYKKLPGDSRFFTKPGNEDGRISGSQGTAIACSNGCAWGGTEYTSVFNHLASAGLYDFKSYDPYATTANEVKTAYPQMTIPSITAGNPNGYAGGIVVGYEPQFYYVKAGTKLRLGTCKGVNPGDTNNGYNNFGCGILPIDAAAIDGKIDDGMPFTGDGVITAPQYPANVPGSGTDQTQNCGDFTTNTYNSSTRNNCSFELYSSILN